MEYRRSGDKSVVRLDEGEELIASLKALCERERVSAAWITGFGFTTRMTLRVYDLEKDEFSFPTLTGAMEITSITGNVLPVEGVLTPHVHIAAGDHDGRVWGGHLVSCDVVATAELLLMVLDLPLVRAASEDPKQHLLRFPPEA